MPIKIILFLSFLFAMSAANAGPLMNRITQLQELQQKINTHCLNNPNRAQVQLVINGTTLTCSHLIVLANRLRNQLQEDVTELQESCEQNPPAQPQRLAADAAAVSRAAACRPVSTDAQCLPMYACAAFTMANPLATLIGGAQRLAGNRRGCLAQGAGAAPGCLQNIVKGIFDSLWGLLSLVWDVGRAAVRSIGEWTGLVRRQERSSSERLMAAQQAGPAFIRRFISNPGQVMNQMISSMFNGIKDAAMNSYGCESWSGAPFVSRCLRPMTNWNCASCQQKLQLMCGVAGFAIGEIGTALLTGGLAAGAVNVARAAKAGVLAGARSRRFSTLATNVMRTLPRPPPALTRAADNVAALAGRTLSAAERNAIRAFNALTSNPLSAAIARGARGEATTLAGRAAAAFTLRPAALYLEALENAAALGFRSVDNALARTTGAATDAAEIARVAEAARPDGLPDVTASVPPDAADVVTLSRTQVDELAGPAEINASQRMIEGVDEIVPDVRTPPPQVAITVGDTPVPVRPVTPDSPVTPEIPVRVGPAPEIPAPVQPREITPALRRASGLSDTQRVEEAGTLLGRELTSAQQEAIVRAHNVGEGTGRGYFTYTPEEITQKGLILREAGFSATEIRALMENGVTGSIGAAGRTADDLFSEARSLVVRGRDTRSIVGRTAPGEVRDAKIAEMRTQFREAAEGYAAEAARTRSPQFIGEAWRLYARSGETNSAVRMMEEGVARYGMNRPAVLRGVDDEIARLNREIAESSEPNPALIIERNSLRDARARFAGVTPQPTPRPVVTPSPAPVPPRPVAQAPPPQVRPQPTPPQVRSPQSVTPREASQLANEYRLGSGGKPRDRRLASEYYYRATDDIVRRETQRTRAFSGGESRFMEDRNFSSAIDESLGSDGSVAIRAIDDIYASGSYKGLNAFLAENFERFNRRDPSPAARANIRRVIERVQEINRVDNALYDPQRNYLRSWSSANAD